jgi:hypothetical protein
MMAERLPGNTGLTWLTIFVSASRAFPKSRAIHSSASL